jgi:gamma-glutamyl hercynylcysteine S-oxide synthase
VSSPSATPTLTAAGIEDAQVMRRAGRELLSLALMDARNVTLQWLSLFEQMKSLRPAEGRSPLWLVGHAAWYQEHQVSRHVQRQRGPNAQTDGLRLASIEPRADGWFDGGTVDCEGLDADMLRAYLGATLETTLELLDGAAEDDAALYVYRAALWHEDRIGESLAELAAQRQLAVATPIVPSRSDRVPLWVPAQRFHMGSAAGGFVPENELGAHEIAVPEFEIDAVPVNWARFVPFAEDGGYDEARFWSEAGWAWVQAQGRRAPRDVEQMRGGVLLMRRGALQRAPSTQPALHLTRHEAEAWCRWVGRRLPTEPEWELAATHAASRGFVWGDVFEWVAGSGRAWPGHQSMPDALDRTPAAAGHGVLRGASWWTRRRAAHPKARRFARLEDDHMFCGFRSCAN